MEHSFALLGVFSECAFPAFLLALGSWILGMVFMYFWKRNNTPEVDNQSHEDVLRLEKELQSSVASNKQLSEELVSIENSNRDQIAILQQQLSDQTEQLAIKEAESIVEAQPIAEAASNVEDEPQIQRLITEKPVIKEHRIVRELEMIKEIPVETVVNIETIKPVEVIKEVPVIQKEEVIKEVEIIKEVVVVETVEVIREIEVIKEVPVEVIKEVEVVKEVQVIKEVPVREEIEVIKEVEVVKEVHSIKEVEVIKEVPVEIIKEIQVIKEVEVVKEVEVPKMVELIKEVPVEIIKEIEVIKEVEVVKEVFVDRIKEVQVIKEVPVEIIKEIQVIKEVEVIKEVPMPVITSNLPASDNLSITADVEPEEPVVKKRSSLGIPEFMESNDLTESFSSGNSGSGLLSSRIGDEQEDDLKLIEGIGPKTEDLLKRNGINSWDILSQIKAEDLVEILATGGSSYKLHDPASWPQQAQLAAQWEWDELRKLQGQLRNGKK